MTDRALFEPAVSSQRWRGTPPSHWPLKRLKWSISGLYNGIWGDEPDGENDILCIRVADFDRVRRSERMELNEELFADYMGKPEIQDLVSKWLGSQIYERLSAAKRAEK